MVIGRGGLVEVPFGLVQLGLRRRQFLGSERPATLFLHPRDQLPQLIPLMLTLYGLGDVRAEPPAPTSRRISSASSSGSVTVYFFVAIPVTIPQNKQTNRAAQRPRNSPLTTFPLAFRGNSPTNSTTRGTL